MFLRRVGLLTTIVPLVALAAAAVAQHVGDEPDLKAIERIRQEAIEPSQVDDIARQLTDVYGPRVTGSPHLKASLPRARRSHPN